VKIMPDFGTVRENQAAFDVAIAAITSGDVVWGRTILVALRDHICSTGEQKSVQWILPQVLQTLEAQKTCTPIPAQKSGRSTKCPEGAPLQNTPKNDHR
jgi:hypothetical protein